MVADTSTLDSLTRSVHQAATGASFWGHGQVTCRARAISGIEGEVTWPSLSNAAPDSMKVKAKFAEASAGSHLARRPGDLGGTRREEHTSDTKNEVFVGRVTSHRRQTDDGASGLASL